MKQSASSYTEAQPCLDSKKDSRSSMASEPLIRHIKEGELGTLLGLYRYLHRGDPPLTITANIEKLWTSILANPHLHYLVCEVDVRCVSTCTITIIPNLTRNARPYGLIENAVTHPQFRGRGLGTKVLNGALELAWDQNCYKVMLMTGCKDDATLHFYQNAGFVCGDKTGLIARPPATQI